MISWDFLRLTAPAAMPGHLGAVSPKKSHDIVILSFCNIVKGQAKYLFTHTYFWTDIWTSDELSHILVVVVHIFTILSSSRRWTEPRCVDMHHLYHSKTFWALIQQDQPSGGRCLCMCDTFPDVYPEWSRQKTSQESQLVSCSRAWG